MLRGLYIPIPVPFLLNTPNHLPMQKVVKLLLSNLIILRFLNLKYSKKSLKLSQMIKKRKFMIKKACTNSSTKMEMMKN